jgi:hypothetical protein
MTVSVEANQIALAAPAVVSVTASSETQPWVARNILDTAPRTYWMSAIDSGRDEWVQTTYASPWVANHASIVLNNGREGVSPVLEGSNDGVTWTRLSSFNAFDYPNDAENFRHVEVSFVNFTAYRIYRYHSMPSPYVLLNSLLFSFRTSTAPAIAAVTASSETQPWVARDVTDPAPRTYWMSAVNAGKDEWIEIAYAQPWAANHATIVLNNGRQGSNPVLEASNDGKTWTRLAAVDAFAYPNDTENFRHIELPFANTTAYGRYRYKSDPTVYLLLNLLEFEMVETGVPPVSACKASSETPPWVARSVTDPAPRTYWMSAINAGKDEWVEITYAEPWIARHASIVLNNGRQGTNPVLEGSNDGKTWTRLAGVNAFDYPNDADNFRHVEVDFGNGTAYRMYRYFSGPTVYVLLNLLKFS